MLTDLQKTIYNTHLAASRSHQNKPFTIRKDFENFETEKSEEYLAILKIEQIIKTSNLNTKVYINAPYLVYADTKYFDLPFYTTQKAIKAYTVHIKSMQFKLPDDKEQLEFIKDSLIFIKDYCIKEGIVLDKYFSQMEGIAPAWANHIVTYKLSIYLFIGFELLGVPIRDIMYDLHPDDREMYLGNIDETYPRYKANINNSIIAKKLIKEGVARINTLISAECLPF
jgi:hypothetical protein